jgi:8-amino-7-oxononanoate synthase
LGLKVLTGYLLHKDMDEDFLHTKIEERKAQNAYRELRLPGNTIDFCSNDYLGIVKNSLLPHSATKLPYGSTGSRLLAGNYALIEETETFIAAFHEAEAGLIFNSGYDANIGLLSCVPQRGDTVLYDYLSHASIRDGIRLSFAQSFSFAHNDLEDLEKKLSRATGNLFVITESVFSMDGDMASLEPIAVLCKKYRARLVVDEAHATGVVGERGEGLVQYLDLQKECFARIHTFGKAVGCHGAIILGSHALRNYLINFSRSFIYTTALPGASVEAIKTSYQTFPFLIKERRHVDSLIDFFQSAVIAFPKLKSNTPVQVVMVPGNEQVKQAAAVCRENNLDVRPILYPAVPRGTERLRIVLHAFNTHSELALLIQLLSK